MTFDGTHRGFYHGIAQSRDTMSRESTMRGPTALFTMLLAGLIAACTHASDNQPAETPSIIVAPPLDAATAGRFAALALACVQKEYPNKIAHVLNSPDDVKPPHVLTPAFYGCYDWHSAVHGHWLLARVARAFPGTPFAHDALTALAANITHANVAGEVAYLSAPGRETFERPYGLAWLLQLASELKEWDAPEAKALSSALGPLELAAADRLQTWLEKLAYPIREGEHAQNGIRVRSRARLGADEQAGARRASGAAHSRVPPERSRVSNRLRAVGPGLPFTLSRGGRPHAARAGTGGVRDLAHTVPASAADRCVARLAANWRGH
jgi:Protein of unknown function (DUF2891)